MDNKLTLIELRGNKDSDKSLILFDYWRYCEIATVVFVIMSLISATIDYEINFSPYRTYNNCYEEYNENLNLRWITFSTSFASIFFVVLGTYSQYKWEDYLYITDPRCRPFKNERYYLKPIFEILLLLIFPYSGVKSTSFLAYGLKEGWVDICYSISELLFSVMWLRFYFILKVVLSYSDYVSHVAKRFAIENQVKSGFIFAFKCMFNTDPLKMIVFFIGIPAIIVIGMMTRVFERPLIFLSLQDWVNPITAVWFSYSTMMLGVYGDFYPLSTYGRLVNVVAYIIGTLFFVLIFVNMQNQAFLTKRQRRAFNDISLMNDAANVIKYSISYYGSVKNYEISMIPKARLLQEKMRIFKENKIELYNMTRQRELDVVQLRVSMRKCRKIMSRIYSKMEITTRLINAKIESSNNF